ncbi:DUF2487 family protein [Metasolibacillus meyeri]|uniref:DUF2487 family protein n=1 Tax=Metasolibacillus meyeri TaxID=1071052 RepID=A0AAW9NNH2_9BACL|nr:DUF2487 family protein [Metasolibacillus meyeri]MEC1179087.1 DUF2487 family protein [Metasolibacillus meyeri]
MFFNAKDVEQFQAHQQFIDTAVVPLLNMDLAQQKIRHSSSQAEFLMSLTAFIEHQFKGRLMLIPPITYLEQMPQQVDLAVWKGALENAGFKHIIFATCDHHWTSMQADYNIIWLPAIPLESMDASMKQKILEDQLKLVIPSLTKEWTGY